MAQVLNISFDGSDKDIPVLAASTDVEINLVKGGNKPGSVIVVSVNTPTSLTFSSDFEAGENSAVFDATKFIKLWIVFDSTKAKAIYTMQLLPAL